jgi:hypothetical protein
MARGPIQHFLHAGTQEAKRESSHATILVPFWWAAAVLFVALALACEFDGMCGRHPKPKTFSQGSQGTCLNGVRGAQLIIVVD